MNKKRFDLNSWNRKSQYDFFKTYDDPFFNLTTQIDITKLYNYCKKNDHSFFLACLYVAVESANDILEFRLRIIKEKLYEYDSINIGSTVLNIDKTFSFCYFKRKKSIEDFDCSGKIVLQKHREGVEFDANEDYLDLIHCSFIPWITFTSFKHARNKELELSGIPKFVFGKYFNENNSKKMPISIEVHHALMDGFHVSKFLKIFQSKINSLA